LPSGYQRDLQEDKEALFSAHDQVADMLAVATGALATTKFDAERLRACLQSVLLATEAADYLVHKGIPFRQAHDIVGKVCAKPKTKRSWTSLPLETLKKISPAFEPDLPPPKPGRGPAARKFRRNAPNPCAPPSRFAESHHQIKHQPIKHQARSNAMSSKLYDWNKLSRKYAPST